MFWPRSLTSTLFLASLLVAGTTTCEQTPPKPPRGVILISVDTLRADHLGTYGYARPTSPGLDAFATEAVVFEQMLAHAPNTPPSHMSMLTGLLPPEHGFQGIAGEGKQDQLSPTIEPLSEILSGYGFATAAFTGGGWMNGFTSFKRGFDHYVGWKPLLLSESTPLALEWLREHPTERFFLLLHTYQVHAPYAHKAPQRIKDLFVDPEYAGKFRPTPRILTAIREGRRTISDADLRHTINMYDAGIRQVDSELSEFIEELRAEGLLDEALLIIASDHGEEFMEHGSTGHWRIYFRPNLHVPFFLRLPHAAGGGRRISERAELVDVVPTALELLGLPPHAPVSGRSWAPALSGGQPPPERATFGWPPRFRNKKGQRSIVAEGHQLLLDTSDDSVVLFDIEADPMCSNDISSERPQVVARLRELWEAEKPTSLAQATRKTKPVRSDMRRNLEALGYVEPK